MKVLITGTNRLYNWELVEAIKTFEHDVYRVSCDTFDEVDVAIKRVVPEIVIDDWKRHSFRESWCSRSFMSAKQAADKMLAVRLKHKNIPWVVLTTAEGCLEFQEALMFIPVYFPTFKIEDWPAILTDAQTKMRTH